jgi:N-acetylmuramoyl-L-alanine amidase
MLRRIIWAAAIFNLLPGFAANPGLIQVTDLRSWSHPGSTRVILQLSGAFEFHQDRAVNPDRLFFDIPHSRPYIAQRRFATKTIGDGLVQRVRIAETVPGTTRIVFDLAAPANVSVEKLEAPDRMVIELTPEHKSSTPVLTTRIETSPSAGTASPPPVAYKVTPGKVTQSKSTPATPQYSRRPFAYPPHPEAKRIAIPNPPVLDEALYVPPLAPELAQMLVNIHPPKSVIHTTSTTVIPAANTVSSPAAVNAAPMPSANAGKSLTRALGLKVNRIVIDAGHGGHDDGTIGPNGVLEKDVVLDVALRLSRIVQERLGAEVILTRSDDTFIPLHERTAIANERKADLFLSIHANSSPAPEVAGTETFFLNLVSSPGATDVAARENAGSDRSVGELKDLIQSITLNDKIEESHTFAETIQTTLQAQAARSNPAAHNRGVKKAPFVVLIGAQMPSVLAEIGFLSNARDESNLNKPEYRQKIAEALYKGLFEYSQSLSHFNLPPRQSARAERPSPSVTSASASSGASQ